MAYHIHRQVRDAVATSLTGLTTTGARVITNRLYAIPATSLPAVVITIDSETIEGKLPCGSGARMQKRTINLMIECCVAGGATIDDTTDQISAEVEVALSAGITVAGKKVYPVHQSSNYEDMAGGQDVAIKRLNYEVTVHTLNSTPDTLQGN